MGPVALTCVCVFESGFSTPIRVSLIVAPDRGEGTAVLFLCKQDLGAKLVVTDKSLDANTILAPQSTAADVIKGLPNKYAQTPVLELSNLSFLRNNS